MWQQKKTLELWTCKPRKSRIASNPLQLGERHGPGLPSEPHKGTNLLTPGFWTYGLQDCKKTSFYCFKLEKNKKIKSVSPEGIFHSLLPTTHMYLEAMTAVGDFAYLCSDLPMWVSEFPSMHSNSQDHLVIAMGTNHKRKCCWICIWFLPQAFALMLHLSWWRI